MTTDLRPVAYDRHPDELRAPVATFGQQAGHLVIGGIPVGRLAERVGSTPFFAYDRRLLTVRVTSLRQHLPRGLELSYAIKANPMPAVVQHLAGLVDSFDVASAGEMRVALDTPLAPRRVSFAGPGKTLSELTRAVAAGVLIEIESATEAERTIAVGERLGIVPQVALRVNPDFEVKGAGVRLGGGPQQFGVDAEHVPSLVTTLLASGVEFHGFHVFAGSQNLRADRLCEAQRRTVALLLRLCDTTREPIRYLNLGGGFGIPYFSRDQPLDLAAVCANLACLLDEHITPRLGRIRVVLELGRYIVGECGAYVTRVIDRKESRGETFLVVDGGLHHQLAASGHFGQVIRRNFPLAVATRMNEPAMERVHVVGCLCTPLDLLGENVSLPAAGVGDLIVVFQAGAYGLTASPSSFLSHPQPVEVLV